MNATTPVGVVDPNVQLLQKLLKVAKAIDYVEKRGRNQTQNYNFAQATDVLRDTRRQLFKNKLLVIPAIVPGSIQHFAETGGKSFVTTFDAIYKFTDTETGAVIEVPWVCAGADIGGEKGTYKAMTGALKYVLLQTFLLPTSDDPENDALSSQGHEPEATGVAKDAERPAAPRIPVDRARLILERALQAGLATPADGPDALPAFTPVLKAKLATLGIEKLGLLNVDQAEDVEAFIETEALAAEEANVEGQS